MPAKEGHSNTANQTPQFKHHNTDQEDDFDGKILVRLSPNRLCGCHSKKQGRGVPAYLIEAMEFVGNTGNSRGNDGLTKSFSLSLLYVQATLSHADPDADPDAFSRSVRNLLDLRMPRERRSQHDFFPGLGWPDERESVLPEASSG